MGSVAKVSKDVALIRYLAMGQTRSLRRLAERLREEGTPIANATIMRWSTNDNLQEQAAAFDAEREKALSEQLQQSALEMDLRQVEIGREMQEVARISLRGILDAKRFIADRDIPLFAEKGSKMERLASGRETSRDANAYNQVIVPVLTLFQQITLHLPEAQRDELTRAFANGVNNIRDSIFVEEEPDDDES